jgi:MFS family permease
VRRQARRGPLGVADFRRLGAAYTVNELGNWLGDVALAVVVFDRTGSPLATAALFLAARFAPALAAPALVARLEMAGRRGLIGTYMAEALVFAALAAAVASGAALGALLALAGLDGVLALTGRSLVRARTAGLFPGETQLRRANAWLNMGMTSAAALGPAVAGVLIATAGAPAALWLDAASFALVALLLWGLSATADGPAAPGDGAFARLREGARYVRDDPRLRRLLGAQAFALVFFTAVIPVEVVLAKGALGAGDAGYGALLASWGGGMVAGGALFALARRARLSWLLAGSTAAIALAYGLMAAAPTLAAACAAAALGGVGNGVQWVALVSALQLATAPALQARVMSLMEALAAATPGVGFVLGGVLAATLGPRAAFGAAAVGAAGATVALAWAAGRAPR